MNKVFLGGTCNGSTWRDDLIPILYVNYFNPVVEDWTPECQYIEEAEKLSKCNVHLYVITCEMLGTFSIAECVESSMTQGKVTILHVMPEGLGRSELNSLEAVSNMVKKHGGISYVSDSIHRAARVINNCFA